MGKQVSADELIEDLSVFVQDTEALLKATATQTGGKIQEVRARAEESLRRAKARLDAVEGGPLRRARALVGETDEYLRANPYQVIGTAAGIGFLLGLLIGRR
jgi:ElaB/YqjD/DUF883 family membrane-anchored ribosome-binding protein